MWTKSMWNPHGIHMDSTCSRGIHMELTWSGSEFLGDKMFIWLGGNPCGIHVDSTLSHWESVVKGKELPNSCVGYTSSVSSLEHCPKCRESHYNPIILQRTNSETKKAQRQFDTIPIGPQLQVLWRSPECANLMRHCLHRTNEILGHRDLQGHVDIQCYDDIYVGLDYLKAVDAGFINPNDMTLMLSIDGAQLYHNKQSDCTIFIWVIFDLRPDCWSRKSMSSLVG
jgi:hypothetical protein